MSKAKIPLKGGIFWPWLYAPRTIALAGAAVIKADADPKCAPSKADRDVLIISKPRRCGFVSDRWIVSKQAKSEDQVGKQATDLFISIDISYRARNRSRNKRNKSMNIQTLCSNIRQYETWINDARDACADKDFPWYRYGSLSNFYHLDRLLSGAHCDIRELAAGQTIVDIGAADGETAFALAKEGFQLEIVDHGPTNMNGLRGARLLNQYFGFDVAIHDVDLDAQFHLPSERNGLAIFLGILYHLKNPYYCWKI
ncbi:hypothetical protein HC761_01145 [bacterium]|nr:hypothetical protein [bacterium]